MRALPSTAFRKVLAHNRQARHLYHIENTLEAGLVLKGWEVKAIRGGQATFNGGASYVQLKAGEAFVQAMTVTPLKQAMLGFSTEETPTQPRKLLLHRAQLDKWRQRVEQRGYTIVPLELVDAGRSLKLNIGLAKGKLSADKRETLKTRDVQRDIQQAMKAANHR